VVLGYFFDPPMLEEDELVLRELAARCKDAKERERLRALYALSIGEKVERVAEIFCVDDATVYRWVELWRTERRVSDAPRDGRPPVLDEKDKRKIRDLIEEGDPKKHGLNAGSWGTSELQAYFARRGKHVSRETLRVCLKGMGAHYVKAVIKYAEADLEKQAAFARQFFEELATKPDSVVVLFQDEMSAGCSARRGYGWTFAKRLIIKSHQRRTRLNCFGAVNPLNGDVVQMSSAEAKAPAFIRFLRKVEKKYADKTVWLYLDKGPVHRARKVTDYLEKHSVIERRFLPPYSPDLNPKEDWWNYLRGKFLNNHSFETTHELATSISAFTRLTPPETVMSVCSLEPLEKLLA